MHKKNYVRSEFDSITESSLLSLAVPIQELCNRHRSRSYWESCWTETN